METDPTPIGTTSRGVGDLLTGCASGEAQGRMVWSPAAGVMIGNTDLRVLRNEGILGVLAIRAIALGGTRVGQTTRCSLNQGPENRVFGVTQNSMGQGPTPR